MKEIEKWAERIYNESDFGRSISTSASGCIGLLVYLIYSDWVLAFFSVIISFPIIRVVSSGLHEKFLKYRTRKIKEEEAAHIYEKLSKDERKIVHKYVESGGTSLTFSQINTLNLTRPAVESLIQREVLWTSMTADGMRETFALDTELFDVAQKKISKR